LILAPPAALGTPWARRLGPHDSALASGWMALRGVRRRRNLATGFTLSDHADWDGLNTAIRQTGATRVFVTHGYTTTFSRWLRDQGYDARGLATDYSGEQLDAEAGSPI
jgi:putative mRNA 3-end processing factor